MHVSKRAVEGYILIDHRNSPGITQEFMAKHNLPGPTVGAGKVYESATYQCHGCGTSVIINPKRTRDREYCAVHDGYLCDSCGVRRRLTGSCVSLGQQLAAIFKRFTRSF